MWVPHDVRDRVVDYVQHWKSRSEIATHRILRWIGVPEGTFYSWKQRYGKVNAASNLKRQQNAHEKKIVQLEEKLQNRNEVVAELLQEHVSLKKELGEL